MLKNIFSAGLCALLLFSGIKGAPDIDTGVFVRDPCVLLYEDTYYMYGTGLAGVGYGCVKSSDLVSWSNPVCVFNPGNDFDGDGNFWAPECHYYNGLFYLFATYHSKTTGKRGVSVFRASSPEGPFEEISKGHITPHDHDSIDGTLYIDENGQPWMVYVSEWTSNEDEIGDMAAAKLSPDLSEFISEPVILFRATDAKWTDGKITDGPWLYKTKNGRLIMLWSDSNRDGYSIGIAYSSNGKIDGDWYHQPHELYKKTINGYLDGGHGMLFDSKDGELLLSLHSPNGSTQEHPTTALILSVTDIGDTVILSSGNNIFSRLYYRVYYKLADRIHSFGCAC